MDFKSVLSSVVGRSAGASRQEQYLAVKISQTEVLATLWSVISGQVTVGTPSGQKTEGDDFASLLSAADGAVSAALGPIELPAAKTIFGVNPDWIADGKIVEEKRRLLKSLCQELDLAPLGYVLLSEALENYLTEVEGAPLTAILVSLDGDSGWVSLFRAGKNLGTKPLPKGEKDKFDLAMGLEKALQQFTQIEVLPARIILHDGRQDLKICEEKIMAHPWTKQLPFLHFPKVEILPGETVVRAVAMASGAQMGGKIEITNEESVEPKPELEEVDAAAAGFVFGEGKTTITNPKQNLGGLEEMPSETAIPKVTLPKPNLAFLAKLPKLKLPSWPRSNQPLPKLIFPAIAGLVALIITLTAGMYFLPKAKLIVHLTPKTFNRELTATISGETVDVTELGTKKGVATGQKLVGDKAAGNVTIYSTAANKTFPSGIILTASSGLKFTLNTEVTVASGAGAASQVTTAAAVTAADIGDNYNLAPGTLFTIGNFPASSYQAKNDATLTGGNSHQATVVTKADQDRLLATLSAELAQKAQTDLNTKLSSGQTLLPNAVTSAISKKTFSKDVDAEGDTVSLDLTVDYKGVTVSQTDLLDRFKEKFPGDIPAGYALDETASRPEIKSAKLDKNSNVVLDVLLNGVALPQLDAAKIISTIAGKNTSTAIETIKEQTGVSDVVVTAQPKFWQFLTDKFLPWKKENISWETVSD